MWFSFCCELRGFGFGVWDVWVGVSLIEVGIAVLCDGGVEESRGEIERVY